MRSLIALVVLAGCGASDGTMPDAGGAAIDAEPDPDAAIADARPAPDAELSPDADDDLHCAADQIVCDDACVDPDTDRAHCGATAACTGGDVCANDELCVEGACEVIDLPAADLSITISDGATAETAGTSITYTIVVTNAGPNAVEGARVVVNLPDELTGASWSCVASSGSACLASGAGAIDALVDLLFSGTATFTLTATVSATAIGAITSTASVTAPPGRIDPDSDDATATDTDTIAPRADLRVAITDDEATVTAGTQVRYRILATSAGPDLAAGATLSAALPASLQGATWSCEAFGGASCGTPSGGSIPIDLPPGGVVIATVTATVAPAATGPLAVTAALAPPAGVPDPALGNNTATDTDTVDRKADLGITKTDGQASVTPLETIKYTIVVTNDGPSVAFGATVRDPEATGITVDTVSCTASSGSSCPAAPSVADLQGPGVAIDLAAGGTATFELEATVTAIAGTITNTATVTAPPGTSDPATADNSASDTDSVL